MRSLSKSVYGSLLFSVLLFPAITRAQEGMKTIKFRVPFEFCFGQKEFPAGEYSIGETEQHVVALRNAMSQTVATVLTNSVEFPMTPASTKLVFQNEGGRYFLTRIRKEQNIYGVEFPTLSAESSKRRKTRDSLAAVKQP
jgi:hypothetical protein